MTILSIFFLLTGCVAGHCDEGGAGRCTEIRGSGGQPLLDDLDCEFSYEGGECPRQDAVGTCATDLGDDRVETVVYSAPAFTEEAAAAECEVNGGEFSAGG